MAPSEILPEELRHAPFTAFEVAQLRSLLFAYTKSPENIPRSRSELLQVLEGIRDDGIHDLLAKLELTQAYKHTYIFRLSESAAKKISTAVVVEWFALNSEKCMGNTNLYPLSFHIGEYISLRFVQPVANYVIERVSQTLFELRQRHARHAVIIAIKPVLGIVEVRFDGFEQTKQTPLEEKLDYADIAEDCRNAVESMLGESVDGLVLRSSIEAMLVKHPKEVAQFGIKSRFKNGNISIDADESDEGDLNSFIAEAFPGINPTIAVSPWTNKNIMLKWPQLKMATRVNFVGNTSDILFLWRRGSAKTLATTDHIIKRLVENSETWSGDARRRLDDAFARLSNWGLVVPGDVAQAGSVALPAALEFLLEKTVEGEAELRYRFHTREHLQDSDNAWVSSLGELPPSVTTISGNRLELSDPKNVEVGFKLVGGAK
ncbi:hypothetical protein SRABI118_03435 [Massilia sp. Bi118]|uniref:hypothetical protein n=1 Tax=Massilia sp. Bi118 TaxID=2822346 RepID=UPI001D897344|nr:hypothetical protein [Massilia sp. Bi118]CAH0269011.1 hypothetical protein SRABI118_03435 [Massilia sp. Bi118]